MGSIWRSIRRTKRKAAKFAFHISCKELVLDCSPGWQPGALVIKCQHRRRKYALSPRQPECGFDSSLRSIVAWPEGGKDPLNVITTLYRNGDSYDDKEWTLSIEEVVAKGRDRPLAALALNMRLFITELPGTRMEAKLKLRPLRDDVQRCTLEMDISSRLLKEGNASDADLLSLASAASGISIPEQSVSPVGVAAMASVEEETRVPAISAADEPLRVSTATIDIDSASNEPTTGTDLTSHIHQLTNDIQKFTQASTKAYDEADDSPTSTSQRRISATDAHLNTAESIGDRTFTKAPVMRQPKSSQHATSKPATSQATPVTAHHHTSVTLENSSVLRDSDETAQSPPLPEHIVGEPLIDWCQRVTKGYRSTAIRDFSKSFKSGLAFCAIIHRYRPELIGDFDELNFAETLSAFKGNCERAFAAAEQLGIKRTLDVSVATLPDRAQIQKFLDTLRYALTTGVTSTNGSQRQSAAGGDPRIPSMYGLSQDEAALINELEILRQSQHAGTPLSSRTIIKTPPYAGAQDFLQQSTPLHALPPTLRTSAAPVDSPILPPSSCSAANGATEPARPNRAARLNVEPPASAFARFKRFGSMRSVELADSLTQLLLTREAETDAPTVTANLSRNATPTRKLMSRLERDLRNAADPTSELRKIAGRLAEIERLDADIKRRQQSVEHKSEAETALMTHHVQLTNERAELVRQQHYYDTMSELNDTKELKNSVKVEIEQMANEETFTRSADDKSRIDLLMEKLQSLVERENELTLGLMNHDEEEALEHEMYSQTMERTRNFNRGTEAPVSASKRFFNMLRS